MEPVAERMRAVAVGEFKHHALAILEVFNELLKVVRLGADYRTAANLVSGYRDVETFLAAVDRADWGERFASNVGNAVLGDLRSLLFV